jgi:CubicO group peptidase (beta-lactamase class C family)
MFFQYSCLALICTLPLTSFATNSVLTLEPKITDEVALRAAVEQQVLPLMQQQQLPGMAVAVLWQGKSYLYSFGLADQTKAIKVTADTLFEVGSISKTFAGVIGAMALARGDIHLTDPVNKHWPALTNPQWQSINLQHLATYSVGGLPLQLPPAVTDHESLLAYYQQWQPTFAPGQQRVYANSSIGLFAHLAAKAGGHTYAEAFHQLTTTLGLQQTYLQVPAAAESQYAWGYQEGKPVRIGRGVLLDEAGGVKASVRDLAAWLQAHLQAHQQLLLPKHPTTHLAATQTKTAMPEALLQAGLIGAQQGYAKAGQIYQGLGWEMLDYPVTLSSLTAMTDPAFVAGRATSMIYPPKVINPSSWVHKTGATSGFGAYAAFIPSRQVGIVILANQRYPNALRVKLAYQILENLRSN